MQFKLIFIFEILRKFSWLQPVLNQLYHVAVLCQNEPIWLPVTIHDMHVFMGLPHLIRRYSKTYTERITVQRFAAAVKRFITRHFVPQKCLTCHSRTQHSCPDGWHQIAACLSRATAGIVSPVSAAYLAPADWRNEHMWLIRIFQQLTFQILLFF